MLLNGGAFNTTAINADLIGSLFTGSTELVNPVVRYELILLGPTNLTLQASALTIRRTLTGTTISATLPNIETAGDILDRITNDLVIWRIQTDAAGDVRTSEIARATISGVALNSGGRNQSLTLTAESSEAPFSAQERTITDVIYKAEFTNSTRYRSRIDSYLTPGDTALIGDESLEVSEITYTIDARSAVMEFAG